MASTKRIAIIGAGFGGLAAAAVLSREAEVTVFERAPRCGGKARRVEVGGRAVDAGPTVFTMRWAFDKVFDAAGGALGDHVALLKLDRLARHYWPDGSSLDLFSDEAASAEAIAAFAGAREARAYLAFCAESRRIFETLREPFLMAPAPSMADLIARTNPLSLLGIQPFGTLWDALSRRFADPRLRQLFGRYATYCGSSPYEAPATLMLVAHAEQAGVWAPDGGMQAVAAAIEAAAASNGARFVYDTHVERVLVEGRRACGLELASGERVEADAVVMNGDAAALSAGLLGEAAARAVPAVRGAVRSQSAMTWAMSAEAQGVDLAAHTVFFSPDYRAEFDGVFHRRAVPRRPTTYVFAPDRIDGAAPDGAERLFCLINAPATGDERPFQPEEIDECRKSMLAHLAAAGLSLKTEDGLIATTTPNDFAEMFPGTGGALYGMASHGWRASFQRPGVRSALPGLYLAGGSAHPGPGAPMAALSGLAAARALSADFVLT